MTGIRNIRLASAPAPVWALAFSIVVAGVVALAAQPPIEEVEDPGAKIKKRILVDDPDVRPGPKTSPKVGSNPESRLEELVKAEQQATHPALRALLAKYSVPFDQLTETRGGTWRIQPVPLAWPEGFQGAQGAFPVTDLGSDNKPRPARQIEVIGVKKLEHFEALLLADADQLLKQKPLGTAAGPDGLTVQSQLETAEKLLAAGSRFHDYARDHNLRRGKGWDAVRQSLADRLRETRVQLLKQLAMVAKPEALQAAGTALLDQYPGDGAIKSEVAAVWSLRAYALATSGQKGNWYLARALLDRVESLTDGQVGSTALETRQKLRELAAEQAVLGETALTNNQTQQASDFAESASRLDPTAPGVSELLKKLNVSPPLYVAVRHFPTRLNPLTARLDSETQAVELVFEGLLEAVPGESAGTRYRLAAASSLPEVLPGGRRLALRFIPRGSSGANGFNSQDVVGTFALHRDAPGAWSAAGLPWFAQGLPTPEGGSFVHIKFRHGHPDPRALLTFKLLPATWLKSQKDGIHTAAFSLKPFGNGPFRVVKSSPGIGRPRELVFESNESFAQGGIDRKGQPFLKEVRMVELTRGYDPVQEFQANRLHVLPDALPAEIERLVSPSNPVSKQLTVVSTTTSRRVHILAVNHRNSALQNRDLRTGLAHAIHRDAILAELVQKIPMPASVPWTHRTAPMVGPFPPHTWAVAKGPGNALVSLHNPDEGLHQLRRYLAAPGSATVLTLLYPDHDPRDALSCALIKEQIDLLFRNEPDGRKLTLRLQALPMPELLVRVQDEHNYELAYVPFDYPDDWYPFGLAAWLDPAAGGRGERNYLGFRVSGSNPGEEEIRLGQWLEELRDHGDFAGAIAPRTAEIQKKFNEVMPFIPLWQLDRYTVVSNRLNVFVDDSPKPLEATKLGVINPSVLFHNVARWQWK